MVAEPRNLSDAGYDVAHHEAGWRRTPSRSARSTLRSRTVWCAQVGRGVLAKDGSEHSRVSLAPHQRWTVRSWGAVVTAATSRSLQMEETTARGEERWAFFETAAVGAAEADRHRTLLQVNDKFAITRLQRGRAVDHDVLSGHAPRRQGRFGGRGSAAPGGARFRDTSSKGYLLKRRTKRRLWCLFP